ncbi:pyridine nucleotide-disulfide oxidoreductase [Gordonia sp. HNM0687]|uniref:Pyridine nucleotide-disulfide oxidoreductase n=1 Tax=Gordonia mangrovi TaxID=2665643 RepID=A0A6L7GNN5_9ACTN|nr:FAD-dependent oxidoreductase [Gordonia mangrovi]MXP21222.1 pyridine nucleotide-disulfide oxidoreductase [Gordonia mangrovi]UVF78249.1 FAD-dependent oxidoreductase [Gordonia mangrovi]
MKLVVVGGVAAGASVAARARRLDESAEIIVFERGHHVSFANCGLPYHVGEVIGERDRLLLQTPQSLRESLNIDVRIATEVIAIDPSAHTVSVRGVDTGTEYTETYDKLALCPGASPVRPPLPGIDHAAVEVLRRIGDMDRIKARLDTALAKQKAGRRDPVHAVVIGAGYIGLEMAENLHHRGATVDVVEMADQILPPVDRDMSIPVEQHLRGRGIRVHLSTAAAAFAPLSGERVSVELKSGTTLPADLVVLAAGVRPDTQLATAAGLALGAHGGIAVDTHMRTSDPDIWAAGDAVETPHTVLPGCYLAPLAGPANREARVAAENICGRDTEYLSTQGTSIVKVFEMVAGGTGATEGQLKASGVDYQAAHVHPSGHAGYYPGTAMMHLKVLFSPDDGRLLGAQACGFDGIDKRLDLMAMAIRQQMTVFDLEHQELAYAPPFGSAKDPINMAGFVASNVLRGDLRLWYAEDFPAATEEAVLVDVRTPEEYDLWHIPGAVNVPLPTLRKTIEAGEWDRAQPLRLYCAVGFRSYLAHRVLVQTGFTDVATLSGGSTTFKAVHEKPEDVYEAMPPMESYAEASSIAAAPAEATGTLIDLDCTGLACPGPIMKLSKAMEDIGVGDEVRVTVSDPGFALDAPAWASKNGHRLVEIEPEGPGYVATMRKGGAGVVTTPSGPVKPKTSMVVFSGELDKLLAAFIIGNGAVSMGEDVSIFFTFWGLNALRREDAPARDKSAMERMMSMMMPSGAGHLPLSTMNFGGAGASMIKKVMTDHGVPTLPELIASAQEGGARLIGCTMTMELLGIAEADLIDGIEFGGVATFLGEAQESGTTLFI